ncbi:MAG TPA: hypothetical protein VF605_07865 [Allosphingosinicella sp.]|jgi:hypothetical protein
MTVHLPPPSGDPLPPRPGEASAPGAPSAVPDIPFHPVPVQHRRDGWTAEKQRRFIQALAETGIARVAAAAVGMSERSAHRLAIRPDAESFSYAWDAALVIAARRGVSTLFEYALDGMVETVWRDGEIAWQRKRPSEKALFFLLAKLDPDRFGRDAPPRPIEPRAKACDSLRDTTADFDLYLDGLHDLPPDEEDDEAGAGDDGGPAGG